MTTINTRYSLAGKHIVVTGAAAGQGLATAQLFADNGAEVLLTDIDESVVDAGQGISRASFGMVHDVSREDSWDAVINAAERHFGTVDVLVNNAGIYYRSSIAATSQRSLQKLFEVNQLGQFLGIKAVEPIMRSRGRGSIINISSTAGLSGASNISVYSMTKWAVRGLTKCAAAELASAGIRVNCVVPGLIQTQMADTNGDDVNTTIVSSTLLGRIGTADEVAAASLFLASDASSYVTGTEIVVDGGLSV